MTRAGQAAASSSGRAKVQEFRPLARAPGRNWAAQSDRKYFCLAENKVQYEIFQCSRKYLLQLAKYLYPKIFHSENISLQQKIFQSTRKYFYCSYGIENLLQPCLNLISWAVQCGGVASRAGNIMVEAVRSTGCHHWAGLTTTNISSSELNPPTFINSTQRSSDASSLELCISQTPASWKMFYFYKNILWLEIFHKETILFLMASLPSPEYILTGRLYLELAWWFINFINCCLISLLGPTQQTRPDHEMHTKHESIIPYFPVRFSWLEAPGLLYLYWIIMTSSCQ